MKFFASFLVGSLTAEIAKAQPNIVQTYFVPLPEQDIFQTFKIIGASEPVLGPITSTISIAVASNGTIIYYDHWEDGFDPVANSPASSLTTQIWGDGNPGNGAPPGHPTDILNGGAVITLDNQVPLKTISGVPNQRDPGEIFFDGSDRISANLPIAVTRSSFPRVPGSLMAGGVEVFGRAEWGREFIFPIDPTNPGSTNPFEYSRFYVMAGFDATTVTVNNDPSSTFVLDEGENTVLELKLGDLVTATRGIQVDLIAGDIGSTYELRWYAQIDRRDWISEYYSPVLEQIGNTGFWFFNPNNVSIAVTWEGNSVVNAGPLSVGPLQLGFVEVNNIGIVILNNGAPGSDCEFGNTQCYSGIRFSETTGLPFYGIAQIDANGPGTIYDWGFPLLPSDKLTSGALIGRGDGCTSPTCNADRSVVWATPIADTNVFVDYDGDGNFDAVFPLERLASLRLVGPGNTMTGAIITSSTSVDSSGTYPIPNGVPVPLSLAWGQDPARSFSGDGQGLDLGTVVVPLANPFVSKSVLKVVNPDGSEDPFKVVDQRGDIIVYEITVSNVGFADLRGVVVDDPLIANLQGPVESIKTDGILVRGETFTYTGNYTVQESDIITKGGGDDNIENSATVSTNSPFPDVTVSTETPIFLSRIQGNVTEDIDGDGLGDVSIPGVVITLKDKDGLVIATTLTDGLGTFLFVDVEAGNYTVEQTNLDSTYTDVSDKDGGNPNSISVEVVGGDLTSSGNNFVDERQGTISGSVNDDNGNPIEGVELQLQDINGTLVATTLTDSDGGYIFTGVSPQTYVVVEPELPLFPTNLSDQDNLPDGDAGDNNTVVDNKIAVTLDPAEDDDGNDFVDGDNGSITGNVTDDNGMALSGVNITLTFPDGSTVVTKTDPKGFYSFTDLEPGDYTVTEQNPDGYPADISDQDATPDGPEDTDTAVDNSISVTLDPAEVDDGNNFVDLLRRGTISGSVQEDTNNDNIGDTPIEGVLIILQTPGGTVIRTALTDEDGNYVFPDVDDGDYQILQTNKNSSYTDVSDLDGGDPNVIELSIADGISSSGNVFVDERPGSISGSVKDDDGNSIPGVEVSLLDNSDSIVGTTVSNSSGDYIFENFPPGNYTVVEEFVTSFPIDVTDEDDTDDGDVSDTDTLVDNKIGVMLEPQENDDGNNFVDSNKGTVSGNVTTTSGNPIEDVLITLTDDSGTVVATTLTGSSGSFTFEGVPPGDYVLTETDSPLFPDSISDSDLSPDGDNGETGGPPDNRIGVTITPGEEDLDNNFVDTNFGSISGTVTEDVNHDGTGDVPIPGVLITLYEEDGVTVIATTLTDTNGGYTFENIEDGTYIVGQTNLNPSYTDVGDSDGGDDNKITVVTTGGESSTGNNFVDERLGSISGFVRDDSGNPIVGVNVVLLDSEGNTEATIPTSLNGTYIFRDVPPGNYTVRTGTVAAFPTSVSDQDEEPDGDIADSDSTVDNMIGVRVAPGEADTGNNFVDSNKGSISGFVVDDDSNPIPFVLITLSSGDETTVISTTLTGTDGAYSFEGLSPGDYTLTEESLPDFPIDVQDGDITPDDTTDTDTTADNTIKVFLNVSESDEDNNFVDSNKGTISGNVTTTMNDPIAGVLITLMKDNSTVVIGTTLTDVNGSFTFEQVPPGDYILTQTDSSLFPDSISDSDLTPDGDIGETGGPADNQISVTITPGEKDADNNFVDTNFGSITGSVTEDTDNNNSGDVPIPGVLITLYGPDGNTVLRTTLTDSNGIYMFDRVEDGTYFIGQENLDGTYTDVSDTDGGNPNLIQITAANGEGSSGNNFVDERPGSIAGTVTTDDDLPLPGVTLVLKEDGTTIATTSTNATGAYTFLGVPPGDYTVEEIPDPDYPTSISDQDEAPDNDPSDTDTTVDNTIGVSIIPAEADVGNNFVDSNKGVISGMVTDDGNDSIPGVTITLSNVDDTVVLATTLTDSNGVYMFTGLAPGNYTLTETNLPGYPGDISDGDSTPDGDEFDTDTAPDNKIKVSLKTAESDDGNDFKDIVESASPSSSPSLPPSLFCKEVVVENCTLCAPFRSPDYCNVSESFPTLLQSRTSQYRNDGPALVADNWWFHYTEDKIAGYVLSATTPSIPAPEVFCCVTSVDALAACLLSKVTSTGIVIKATNFHSNQGVFVLTGFSSNAVDNPNDPLLFDVIDGMSMSYNDIVSQMSFMAASKIIVEEFIGTQLPTEYKFHVVNGTIAAVDIIAERGGECPCYTVIDTNGVRLDKYGCFEPGGYEMTDADGCTVIDFTTGKKLSGPVKKDLYICEDVPEIDDCLFEDMIKVALELGEKIGVYIRVDMFVTGGKFYVQEYTANHMNGLRHCAAKEEDGCINSCFLGELYAAAGLPFGGVRTPVPPLLTNYAALTPDEQCALLDSVTAPADRVTVCPG